MICLHVNVHQVSVAAIHGIISAGNPDESRALSDDSQMARVPWLAAARGLFSPQDAHQRLPALSGAGGSVVQLKANIAAATSIVRIAPAQRAPCGYRSSKHSQIGVMAIAISTALGPHLLAPPHLVDPPTQR